MNLLEICNAVCSQIQLPNLSMVVNSQNDTARRMKALLEDAVNTDIRNQYAWPELTRQQLFPLVDGQEGYNLPWDIDFQHFCTQWNRGNTWPLWGPLTTQQWQAIKSGMLSSLYYSQYMIKGYVNSPDPGSSATILRAKMQITPTPSSSDAGKLIAFEYQSAAWVRPMTWAQGQTVAIGDYRSYGDNVYIAASAGTTGSIAPTWTSGTFSDESVSWTYASGPTSSTSAGYVSGPDWRTFQADTDFPLLDSWALVKELKWRFLRQVGQPYQEIQIEAAKNWKSIIGGVRTAQPFSMRPAYGFRLIGPYNLPDTGYGGI